MNDNYYQLRSDLVRSMIRGQGLKKYWVADECGVHKTTLRRWLSGRITKVRRGNVERLAHVLTTPPGAISHPWRR